MEAPPVLPPAPSALAAAEVQRIKDAEHLRLLGIGYYIVGAFTALFGCFGLMYVGMGLLVLAGGFPDAPPRPPHVQPAWPDGAAAPADAPRPKHFDPTAAEQRPAGEQMPRSFDPALEQRWQRDHQPPRVLGLIFAAIGAVFVSIGLTVGGLTIYAGRCLHQRRHRVFTMVMAGLNCLQVPFGTALGVFSFLVLQRPSVEALYRVPPGAAGPLP